ncbi:biotin transporter BioY [Ruminococcus sp.]|uniref:biotin transporter BioY n=1 Tax=Ruminococcus sp. TaxID=41978 RepID=UPI001B26B454|nr:biotin transporter BioY [Ruminococcus sp.]MBO5557392.1 biotin transporter BioY [Ruminococcus sp.]
MSDNKSTEAFMSTKDLALTGMFAVVIAVCSWISIPTAVPFTLQTFAVFSALGLLGGKRGFFAALVYMLLGAVGLPVFAGFKSGVAVLLGSTGGYIVGFLIIAGVYWVAEVFIGKQIIVRIISMVIGLALCYLFGTFWFVTVFTRTNGDIGLFKALQMCVIPFVIWDLLKMALALSVTSAVGKRIKI